MKRLARMAFWAMGVGSMASPLASCSKQLSCGPGTVEKDDECVQAGTPTQPCPNGGSIVAGVCYPLICGTNTKFDPATETCVGITGMTSGCSSTCGPPGLSTFCLTGTAKLFIGTGGTDGPIIAPTAISHAK